MFIEYKLYDVMIDARELRIGNWVISGWSTKPIQVDLDALSNHVNQIVFCGPIPLTPEILIAAGFAYNHARINEWWETKELTVYNKDYKRKNDKKFEELSYNIEIKYLHQLQNLYYSLTQTELNITL